MLKIWMKFKKPELPSDETFHISQAGTLKKKYLGKDALHKFNIQLSQIKLLCHHLLHGHSRDINNAHFF